MATPSLPEGTAARPANEKATLCSTTRTTSLVHALILYGMPFMYGGATRLPFIYFVIHLVQHFRLDWLTIGCYVGSYQATRVVVNGVSMFSPKVSHLVGTVIGLAGNLLVLLTDNANLTTFVVGTVAIGFSESMGALQRYVKEDAHISSDLKLLEHKLKMQYASVMLGVTFAFGFGGFVYDRFGIDGVSLFGVIMLSTELVLFVIFIALLESPDSQDNSTTETDDDPIKKGNPTDLHEEPQVQTNKSAIKSSKNTTDDSETGYDSDSDHPDDSFDQEINTFSSSGINANYVTYVLCVTIGIEAITIGYNLSISPIFILTEFDMDATTIGIMFAVGAASGTFFSILATLTKTGKLLIEKYQPLPNMIYVALGGITVGVFLAAVPSFPVHVMGIIVLMGMNDFAAMMLIEMIGAVTSTKAYSKAGPLAQVIRRSLNVVTAVSGPLLFGIAPRLPYIVAGVVTALWTVLLFFTFRRRTRRIEQRVTEVFDEGKSASFHGLSYTRKEIVARQVKEEGRGGRNGGKSTIMTGGVDTE